MQNPHKVMRNVRNGVPASHMKKPAKGGLLKR
jgi:hypothetical protein